MYQKEGENMKRIFAVLLAGMMACSLAACGQVNSDPEAQKTTTAAQAATDAVIDGGYSDSTSPVLDDQVKAVFAKATETLTGVSYEPVAYVATQVVAGTNHVILCKATATVPDAVTTYALVTVYEDLNGGAEIIQIQDCKAQAPESGDLVGGYAEPESPEVTDEAREALVKAAEKLDGASYKPKALLGTQVVAGTNYKLLCEITPVVPNAASHYAIVTVYADLEGNAEITETVDFNGTDDEPDADAEPQSETSQG